MTRGTNVKGKDHLFIYNPISLMRKLIIDNL